MKEMRLSGIDSIQGANHFLEMRFLPEWEQRFTVVPRQSRNAHRHLGSEHRLEEILSVRVERKVAEDHTVSWDGNRWGLLREEVCAGLRGAAVEIERRLDGSHWLRYHGRYLHLRPCPEPVRQSASPSGLRPPGLAEQIPRPKNKIQPKYHVPADHPWRWMAEGRMETERITLSQRERDRLKVLHEVKQKHLSSLARCFSFGHYLFAVIPAVGQPLLGGQNSVREARSIDLMRRVHACLLEGSGGILTQGDVVAKLHCQSEQWIRCRCSLRSRRG